MTPTPTTFTPSPFPASPSDAALITSLRAQISAISDANDLLRDEAFKAIEYKRRATDLLHRSYLVIRALVGNNENEQRDIDQLNADLAAELGIRL